jgi:hypothetical protein
MVMVVKLGKSKTVVVHRLKVCYINTHEWKLKLILSMITLEAKRSVHFTDTGPFYSYICSKICGTLVCVLPEYA